jgi:glycosyltransferase involved in cell wall biosynthesis
MPTLEFLVPGDLRTATGGYGYDRRIVNGLREMDWHVDVHELDDSFPFPSPPALAHAEEVLARLPDGSLVMMDGLALGAMPREIGAHAQRLRLVALIHHPLCLETGLAPDSARALEQSERAALQVVRHVVATSRATRNLLQTFGVPQDRITVVEPGTDPAPLAKPVPTSGPVALLCVATVMPRKGHALLIEALASLDHLQWRLTCIGSLVRDVATVSSLRNQIKQAGLQDRVTLIGQLEGRDLEAHYATADAFVLPTLYEGYGMVVAEARAHGLPVVSTTTGAIAELVSRETGILVPPGDVKALREALRIIVQDADRRAAFSAQARLTCESLPRWPDACARMAATLAAVCRQ